MLSIRLTRVGKKKHPMYRVTVMEKGRDPYGRALEILGTVNPHTAPRTVNLKKDRIQHWVSNGAEMTDTVWNLCIDEGIVEGEKRSSVNLSKKRRAKIDEKAAEAKAKEEEAKAAAEAEKAAAEAAPAEEEKPAEEAPAEAPQEEAAPEEKSEEAKEEA